MNHFINFSELRVQSRGTFGSLRVSHIINAILRSSAKVTPEEKYFIKVRYSLDLRHEKSLESGLEPLLLLIAVTISRSGRDKVAASKGSSAFLTVIRHYNKY